MGCSDLPAKEANSGTAAAIWDGVVQHHFIVAKDVIPNLEHVHPRPQLRYPLPLQKYPPTDFVEKMEMA